MAALEHHELVGFHPLEEGAGYVLGISRHHPLRRHLRRPDQRGQESPFAAPAAGGLRLQYRLLEVLGRDAHLLAQREHLVAAETLADVPL